MGFHAVPEGGQVGGAGVVDAHGQSEVFDGCPDRVVVFVVQVAIRYGIGADVEPGGSVRGRSQGFLDGEISGLHREHGGPTQPLGGTATVFATPVVVGGAHGGEQFGVGELLAEDLPADGWIEDLDVDTVPVHVGEPRLWPKAGSARLLVFLHAFGGRLEELLGVHGVAAVLFGDRLPFDAHADPAVAHVVDARCPVGECRRDVVLPHAWGFHLVGVRVDYAMTQGYSKVVLTP